MQTGRSAAPEFHVKIGGKDLLLCFSDMSHLRTLTFVEDDEAQMPGETPSDAAMLRHHQVNWVAVQELSS